MACMSCARSLHFECSSLVTDEEGLYIQCCCQNEDSNVGFTDQPTGANRIRTYKGDDVSVSAGRKRAAVEYPIDSNAPCEWRGLANCGGGKYPILGCLNGNQEHRHHGPDKTTTNNHLSNIHRICTTCHNRWHARNNKVYDVEYFKETAHKPRPATAEDHLGD